MEREEADLEDMIRSYKTSFTGAASTSAAAGEGDGGGTEAARLTKNASGKRWFE